MHDSSGCCISGYHSAVMNVNGTQAFAYASYIDEVGNFAQDVSALSHEVGEWLDDPLVTNNCNQGACGILEVGDPAEGFPLPQLRRLPLRFARIHLQSPGPHFDRP